MNEMLVRLVSLPTQIRAMTSMDNNGDYNIYINENLTYEMQYDAYKHELKHINNGDYEKKVNIVAKEKEYHQEVK